MKSRGAHHSRSILQEAWHKCQGTSLVECYFFDSYLVYQWMAGDAKAEDYAQHIDERTKLIYTESIGNPKYQIADISGLAKVRPFRRCRCGVSDFSFLGCSCAWPPPHRGQHLWHGRSVPIYHDGKAGYLRHAFRVSHSPHRAWCGYRRFVNSRSSCTPLRLTFPAH